MDTTLHETEQHSKKFERFERETKQPAWVSPLRKAGLARFVARGFPTLRDEDWRFTNLAPIARLPFKPVFQTHPNGVTPQELQRFLFTALPAVRLVFLDGQFAPALSALSEVETNGATITNLAAALAQPTAVLHAHLARHLAGAEDPFASLNTAFFQDGAFIHVPPGKRLETPIHLLFLSTAKETGATTHPRNLIVLERGSHATVLETYVSLADAAYFTNAVTELALEDGAGLEHCKFQDESLSAFHMAAVHAHLGRGSNLVSHSIALGAKLSSNNIYT